MSITKKLGAASANITESTRSGLSRMVVQDKHVANRLQSLSKCSRVLLLNGVHTAHPTERLWRCMLHLQQKRCLVNKRQRKGKQR